jgi:hypothetical protein
MGARRGQACVRAGLPWCGLFFDSHLKAGAEVMKFGSQIALALVAIVGLVGGITFLSQYRIGKSGEGSSPGSPNVPVTPIRGKPPGASNVPELKFPLMEFDWDPPSAGEFEFFTKNHYDFWFDNSNSVPIDLGLMSKSCKCSTLYLCVLTPEEAKRYVPVTAAAAAGELGFINTGILSAVTQLQLENEVAPDLRKLHLKWTEMPADEHKGTPVPAEGGGLVRVTWAGKKDKFGEERLSVVLWTQPHVTPNPRTLVRLGLPLTWVPVLRVTPGKQDLGDFSPREEKTAQFMCWSSVRATFPLSVRESTQDPCISCSIIPMTDDEYRSLQQSAPIRSLYGYRVRVTVRERLSDTVQMELGPFTRRIELTSPGVQDALAQVTGIIRGDVTVGAEEDKGKIRMGSFRSETGKTRTVRLTALQPNLNLRIDRVEPPQADYLKVKYLREVKSGTAESTKRWDLCVEVPPGSPEGTLPEHCAVILQIQGTPPRHIRIPVTGMVYQH